MVIRISRPAAELNSRGYSASAKFGAFGSIARIGSANVGATPVLGALGGGKVGGEWRLVGQLAFVSQFLWDDEAHEPEKIVRLKVCLIFRWLYGASAVLDALDA